MKKTRKPLQWLMYTIAIGVLVFGTIALVYFAQGYSYDFKSGQIRNSGLVLLDSHPNGATITLNGKNIPDKTPYRYDNASGGDISVVLQKPGYQVWSTKQIVVPGEVTFIEYPLLLPNELKRQAVSQPVSLLGLTTDTTHKKGVSVSLQKDVYLITDNGTATRIYSAGTSVVDLAEISPDGNRVLVRQTNPDNTVNQVLIATSGGSVINLTAQYGSLFPNLQFSTENSADLFWLDNGLVRKIDTNSQTISSALISNVISYSLSRDRIIATIPSSIPTLTNMIVSTNLSGNDRHDVAALPVDQFGYSGIVIHSRFHTYLIVRSNSDPKSLYYIYEPFNRNALPFKIADNVTIFSSSPNQKFLTYLNNEGIHSLDLETNREYHHTLDTKSITSLNWYDDYHPILQAGAESSIIDFDGYNQHTVISNSTSGFLLPGDSKSLLYLLNQATLEKVLLESK